MYLEQPPLFLGVQVACAVWVALVLYPHPRRQHLPQVLLPLVQHRYDVADVVWPEQLHTAQERLHGVAPPGKPVCFSRGLRTLKVKGAGWTERLHAALSTVLAAAGGAATRVAWGWWCMGSEGVWAGMGLVQGMQDTSGGVANKMCVQVLRFVVV